MRYGLCILLLASFPARADDAPKALSAYQRVMQAQYSAKAAPLPARPEEAQRIYDNYLRSIGQPAKEQNMDTGGNAGVPAH